MRELRAWLALLRHALLLVRSGQLRFRLETFGLYYPSLPYRSPAWRPSPRVCLMLLRQSRSYAHWLVQMEDLRRASDLSWPAPRVRRR